MSPESAPALRRLASCGSTNQEAARWLAEGAPHMAAVVADVQTAGRGRRGRGWFSPPGAGLWVSVVLRPLLPLHQAPLLALAGALAARDALAACGVGGVALKWPNDLLLGGRKLGGVLAELHGGPDGTGRLAAVVGVGVNLSVPREGFPEEIRPFATSVRAETGSAPGRDDVLHAFLGSLSAWSEILSQGGAGDLIERFAAGLAGLGREVEVALPEGRVRGVATGIGPGGELLLRDEEGRPMRILAGDVRMIEDSAPEPRLE